MKPNGVPETDQEADALRGYLPVENLIRLANLRDVEIAASEVRTRRIDDCRSEIKAIKERMKKDRLQLKRLAQEEKELWATPIFQQLDAAREAAWIDAGKLRTEALARGDAPLFETVAQCGARQKSAQAAYTP
jgi:hypothetical protein